MGAAYTIGLGKGKPSRIGWGCGKCRVGYNRVMAKNTDTPKVWKVGRTVQGPTPLSTPTRHLGDIEAATKAEAMETAIARGMHLIEVDGALGSPGSIHGLVIGARRATR